MLKTNRKSIVHQLNNITTLDITNQDNVVLLIPNLTNKQKQKKCPNVCVCVCFLLAQPPVFLSPTVHSSQYADRKKTRHNTAIRHSLPLWFVHSKQRQRSAISQQRLLYISLCSMPQRHGYAERELFQSVLTFRCRVSCLGIMTLITPGCKPVKCSFVCHDLVTYLAN